MLYARIQRPAASQLHTSWCGCHDCLRRDPIAFGRARRLVRIQAGILLAFVAALYGTALLCAPEIAATFGVSFR